MRSGVAERAMSSNPELRRGLIIVAAVSFVALLAAYLTTLQLQDGWVRETHGFVLGRDFLNFWMAGRAAWEPDPGRYYDPAFYTATLQQLLGGRYMQQWSYPPMLLLLAAPFGQLPYLLAYAVWTGLGFAALWRALGLYDLGRGGRACVMLSPATLFCLLCGQNALFTAAAMLAMVHWRQSRPVVAGLLLGLLSCKPQVALLLPVMLLAERNWRALAMACATTLALLALTAMIFGLPLLQHYWAVGMPAQAQVLREPAAVIAALMPTAFIQLWLLGLGYAPAMWLQGMLGLATAVLVYRLFRHTGARVPTLVVLAMAGVLATPYLLSYDLIFLAAAVVLLSQHVAFTRVENWALALCFFLPWVNIAAVLSHAPLTMIPLLAVGFASIRRVA